MTLGFPLTTLAALQLSSSFVLGGHHTLQKRGHLKQGTTLRHIHGQKHQVTYHGQNSSASMADDQPGHHRHQRSCSGREVDYTVRTKTGSRGNAGTDDNIYISITAANCNFGEFKLDDPNRDDFERGHEDAFTFSSLHLGTSQSLSVRLEGSSWWWITGKDWWYVEYIKVTDHHRGLTWQFNFNRWIA